MKGAWIEPENWTYSPHLNATMAVFPRIARENA